MMRSTAIWLAKIAAGIAAILFIVLWTGPRLNAQPDARHEFSDAARLDAELKAEAEQARVLAEANHRCLNSPSAANNFCVVRHVRGGGHD